MKVYKVPLIVRISITLACALFIACGISDFLHNNTTIESVLIVILAVLGIPALYLYKMSTDETKISLHGIYLLRSLKRGRIIHGQSSLLWSEIGKFRCAYLFFMPWFTMFDFDPKPGINKHSLWGIGMPYDIFFDILSHIDPDTKIIMHSRLKRRLQEMARRQKRDIVSRFQ